MRPLGTLRATGLLAAGALLIAACGGNAATSAPASVAATSAPATNAPATAAIPTDVPGATGGLPSFALPSFHGDTDLESLIPTSLGGEPVSILSMTGDQFLGGEGSPELEAALGELGKTPADLSVAFAGNTKISVVAFRVKGVPADTLFSAFKEAETDGYTVENVSYAGKSVVKLTPADGTVGLIYLKDDTMFLIGGSGDALPGDDLLNEAFSKLP